MPLRNYIHLMSTCPPSCPPSHPLRFTEDLNTSASCFRKEKIRKAQGMMGSNQPPTSGMNWKWAFRSPGRVDCLVLESDDRPFLSFKKSVRAWLYCYTGNRGGDGKAQL